MRRSPIFLVRVYRLLPVWTLLFFVPMAAWALDFADADMELPGRGPWQVYGTPVRVEKSDFARNGRHSLRVVTDNRDTMGGNYEGISHALGEFQAGDRIKVSFWYWVKDGRSIVVGMGPTWFQVRRVMTGTDWTRAEVTLRVTKPGPHAIWISQGGAPTEFFLDDFSLEVTRRPQLGIAAPDRRLALTGGALRLTLDRDTGTLCGIENLATGEICAPLGKRQPLFTLEVLSRDGRGYERIPFTRAKFLSLDAAGSSRAKLLFRVDKPAIRIRVAIALDPDGAARFTGSVQNNSKRPILSFEMPMVYGVRPAGENDALTLVDPHICGRIVRDAAKSAGCQTRYPGRGVMGWLDLAGPRGGLYFATHDRSRTGTRLAALPVAPGRFDLSLTREILVRPGASWQVPPAVLAAHAGDWHAAADRYRAWARSWMRPPDVPQWLYDDNGWVLMGIQNGIPFRRIPDIFRQAQWMGIQYLHVQGEGIDNMWFDRSGKRHGHTMTYPYPSPRFGTVAELKNAVAKVHAAGGHVMFYFLYERWTPSHESADDFGTGRRRDVPKRYWPPKGLYARAALVETPGGAPNADNPFMAIRAMCLGSPRWREWMRHWAVDVYAGEFGADGFYWDVMGRNGPFRCFNARHGHAGQNEWAAGSAAVLETVIREGRKRNPDYSCAIEGCSDHLGQWVGYHLMSGATKQPRVFRYTFPEYLCVDGLSNHYWKWTDIEKARRVFLDGEKFDIHGYHQQIRKVIDLRRRVKPFIDWPAVYRDTLGLRFSDPRIEARCFLRSDGANRFIAVTMLNEKHVQGATIEVDAAPLGKILRGHVFHLDGRVTPLALEAGKNPLIPVPAEDVAAAVLCGGAAPAMRIHAWLEQIRVPGPDGVTLSIYMPAGPVNDLAWELEAPAGVSLKEVRMPTPTPGLIRVRFLDEKHLQGWKRWSKLQARLTWTGSTKTVWTMAAPPLVNGNMEEVEDKRLAGWGLPPCPDQPATGKYCLRLDRKKFVRQSHVSQLTPLKPGVKYRFSCRIRRSGKGWAGAHVIEYEGGRKQSHAFRRSAALNATKTGVWETLETSFVSHPDPRTSAVYLYTGDAEHPVFFDDIRLEEIRAPARPVDGAAR